MATNDDDGNVDELAVRRYLDADPLDPYGFSGWVGPEPHGAPLANAGVRRDPLIAARVVAWLEDRYARRARGRRRRASTVPAGGELRQPARHRAVPGVGPAGFADRAGPARSAARATVADRRRGPLDQARGADRLPRVVSDRLRAGGAGRQVVPRPRPGVPRPLLPAPRRGRRADRSGARARSPPATRAERPTRRSSSARSTTASCSAPTAGCTRSGSTSTTRPPGCRSRWSASARTPTEPRVIDDAPTSHVDLVPDAARRRRHRRGRDRRGAARRVQRGAPAAGPQPDAGRRRSVGTGPEPAGVCHDQGQHARGRHRCVRVRSPARADGQAARAAADQGAGPRRCQLRRRRRAGRRRRCPRRWRPPLEARAHLRRPGDVDRAGRPPPRRQRPARRRVPHRAAGRPVGALRPHRRPDRARQPLARRRRRSGGVRPPPDGAEAGAGTLGARAQRAVAVRASSPDGAADQAGAAAGTAAAQGRCRGSACTPTIPMPATSSCSASGR